MLEMGRIEPDRDERNTVYVEHCLSSSALGDNVLKYIHMPGRILIDLMKVVRDHKPTATLSTPWLSTSSVTKKTTSPWVIFRLQQSTDTDRATVASIGIQDSSLCNFCAKNSPPWLEVSEWRRSVPSHAAGFSCVVRVKILSLVSVQCKRDNFAIPLLGGQAKTSKFEGALVLEPETGVTWRIRS
jgi:DNA polymerase elongation subunit (family B)